MEFTETIWSDREEPAIDAYLDLQQKLFGHFWIRGRYGLLYYNDKNPDRYAWYQLAKLSIEAKY